MLVVVDEVADDLHARRVDFAADPAAQNVEMPLHARARLQMHARLDDRFAAPLHGKAGLDRRENLAIGQHGRLDVEAVEVGDVDGEHVPVS